jgi:hypothetical protein
MQTWSPQLNWLGGFLVLTRHAPSMTLPREWPTVPHGCGTERWSNLSVILRLVRLWAPDRFRDLLLALLGVSAQPEQRLGQPRELLPG